MNSLVPSDARILEATNKLLKNFPQVSGDVRHIFGPGLYMREITIPGGSFAVGHWQRFAHMNILLKGAVRLMQPDGSLKELHSPMTFMMPPGRKVGHIIEDMTWINVYATDETDVEKLEEYYLDKSGVEASQPPLLTWDGDYERMLNELGVTEDLVRRESEFPFDQIPFPLGAYKVRIGKSQIQGQGLIASATIQKGEVICPMRLGSKRTPAGRFTNHSGNPNSQVLQVKDDLYLIAIRQIQGNLGGMDGEEITIDYRETYSLRRILQ